MGRGAMFTSPRGLLDSCRVGVMNEIGDGGAYPPCATLKSNAMMLAVSMNVILGRTYHNSTQDDR